MAASRGVCLVCGEALAYSEQARELVCSLCGKTETGHSTCVSGHYVCDSCHREKGVERISEICGEWGGSDPIELAQRIMREKEIYPNGPEHHTLVGACLLACYANAGGGIDLPRALDELRARSLRVPGGTCGFWGCCGAATSAGQFYSIVSGATPMTDEPWSASMRLTSRILARMADVGGPRCCKRTSFIAIEETVPYVKETLGVSMSLPERVVCTFMSGNAQCRGKGCPFFGAR